MLYKNIVMGLRQHLAGETRDRNKVDPDIGKTRQCKEEKRNDQRRPYRTLDDHLHI